MPYTWNRTIQSIESLEYVAKLVEPKLETRKLSGTVEIDLNDLRAVWRAMDSAYQVLSEYRKTDPKCALSDLGFVERGFTENFQPFYLRRKDGKKILLETFQNFTRDRKKFTEEDIESVSYD